MVWAAIPRWRSISPARGSKHYVHLFLPFLSAHTATHPPPSRNHSADIYRASPLEAHWIPLASLAGENQSLPTLSPTPEVKGIEATRSGGIALLQATHALPPVVSRRISSLSIDRRTHRTSHQKPEWCFEISGPTRQRLLTPFQGIITSNQSSGIKGTTQCWASPMDSWTKKADDWTHSAR